MTPRPWRRRPWRKALRPCRFPCAFLDARVRLASRTHSLARFSKRTTEHRLPAVPTGGSPLGRFPWDLVCPVALSPADFRPCFTPLLRVLCSVRSRYWFAIGLESCLALAVDACHIHEGFPTPATPGLAPVVLVGVTGLSPCLALRSRRLHTGFQTLVASPYTTWPRRASVWAVSRSLAVSNDIPVGFSSCRY